MKKFIPLTIAASITFATLPASAFALSTADSSFQNYLNEIGMTQAELEEYLSYDGYTLDDFQNVEELRAELGDLLTEENLQTLLIDYDLTEEELKEMLVEYGELEPNEEITDAFKFYNDLEEYVDFMLSEDGTPITEETLSEFLQEQDMTKEQLIELLENHGESLEDYTYIEDLAASVEYYNSLTPITEETLKEFLDTIGLSRQQLEQLLAENDDSLENYTTVEELSMSVMFYMMPDFDELGLTDNEIENLLNHFFTLNVEDPQFVSELEKLGERLETISLYNFDGVNDLSPAQVTEIADVMHDMLDLFELDVKFYLMKDGKKTPLSFASLLKMESTNGYDLFIEIYNKQGDLLADMTLTAEMFDSDLFEEVSEDLEKSSKIVKLEKISKPVKSTIKGGKLPKTASPYMQNMIIGVVLAAAGAFLFRTRKIFGEK
ncbi:processed acidic surface protein [Anoxybacillus calidus]|jgi:processed acidic surface protein|uniref:Processed acidic surface protein n=1 Tax=[Anoxybacillus] calidus TaxID=575178 RepID=A0A7W0BX16_9BACL|nr:processed acidic surface protein [Anoxybacillus calidus]MBA2871584.1 processed acidic surface protein [Anoxybacillus calidus]